MYENGARAMKELKSLELLHKPLIEATSVVARTCNSATLKAEFRTVWVWHQLGVTVLRYVGGLCDHL